MRAMRQTGHRRDAPEGEWRRRLFPSIDEQGELPARQVEHVLDIELEVLDQFDLPDQPFIVEPVGQSSAEQRADGVVAPARVADREDDQWRRHALLSACTTCPSTSTSSTASGILPSACVAQDRQGSKARMATSMWLSRPSVTSRPFR